MVLGQGNFIHMIKHPPFALHTLKVSKIMDALKRVGAGLSDLRGLEPNLLIKQPF